MPATTTATSTSGTARIAAGWTRVCALDDLAPWCGAAALLGDRQIAILRWGDGEQVYALSNFDPFSKAMVISRGIVGDHQGEPTVASPVYKQRFRLRDGTCIDDPEVHLASYPVRIAAGAIEVRLPG